MDWIVDCGNLLYVHSSKLGKGEPSAIDQNSRSFELADGKEADHIRETI